MSGVLRDQVLSQPDEQQQQDEDVALALQMGMAIGLTINSLIEQFNALQTQLRKLSTARKPPNALTFGTMGKPDDTD